MKSMYHPVDYCEKLLPWALGRADRRKASIVLAESSLGQTTPPMQAGIGRKPPHCLWQYGDCIGNCRCVSAAGAAVGGAGNVASHPPAPPHTRLARQRYGNTLNLTRQELWP